MRSVNEHCGGMNQFLNGADRPPSSSSSSYQKRRGYHAVLLLTGITLPTGNPPLTFYLVLHRFLRSLQCSSKYCQQTVRAHG
jgi:hypothetical protein